MDGVLVNWKEISTLQRKRVHMKPGCGPSLEGYVWPKVRGRGENAHYILELPAVMLEAQSEATRFQDSTVVELPVANVSFFELLT